MSATDKTKYIWHPYTQMKLATEPIHIVKGAGALLWDEKGNKIIDAISSWWVNIHGHANPHIAKAIAEQAQRLEQVIFAGFTHSPALDLAEKLINVLGAPFSKIFYSDNGSTSVEVAMKMALQFWHNKGQTQKTILLAFEDAYHGDTFGAMSVSAPSAFNGAFKEHLFEVKHIPCPDETNIARIKQLIKDWNANGNIAAFIFEPLVQGAGGMKMHSAKYLDELLSFLKQEEILCIADEVMTGFGRTGSNFAIDQLKQKPDMICLSKGITGGFLPMGVTACTEEIYQAFYSNDRMKTFFHGHSYTANPLACAAANASLDLLLGQDCKNDRQRVILRLSHFANRLAGLRQVENVRQCGCILAFDLKSSEKTSYFNQAGKSVSEFFMERGVLLRPLGNVLYLMPPYCISDEELEFVFDAIREFLVRDLAL